MSPEIIAALVGIIATFSYILKQQANTKDTAKRQELATKKRQDNIENDAHLALIEKDKLQSARIDQFAQSFQDETVRQDKKIETLSKDLQSALVDKARVEGRLTELIRNQDIARAKMEKLSNRVHELESDKKRNTETIEGQLKTIEKQNAVIESLQMKLSDSSDMISAKMLQINVLTTKLETQNGTKTTEVKVVADNQVETHISNVQTAKKADNQIKENE